MPPVVIVRFENRSEVLPLVRAALEIAVAHVALSEVPPPGPNTLKVYVGDELAASLSAELVGPERDGEYPLRLRPLDAWQAGALIEHVDEPSDSSGTLDAVGEAPSAPPSSESAVGTAPPSGPPAIGFVDEPHTLESRSSAVMSTREQRGDTPARLAVVPPRTPPPPSSGASSGEAPPPPAASALPVPSARPVVQPFFADDESQTLPGSSRAPGVPSEASWNVRIAPTTHDPLCGRTIGGGKYVLDSVIGTGAIGIVFKASHRDLGRTVAIKVLNPRYRNDADLLDVFRTEARAASQLEHPNVARVYDFGQEPDGLVYIVMEYLSGYTLGSVLEVRHKLTAARSVELMVQVCGGLSAAHDRQIVHRDVKPDNIVLVPVQDDEGRPAESVKVCDFGIAALATTHTAEGTAAGTPDYMAPEQTTGSPVSPAADVYACGVVLYEMLTGQVPFAADQAYRVLMMHRSEAPRAPSSLEPSVSAALEAVVLRCMEKVPAQRYQSARELRVELRRL